MRRIGASWIAVALLAWCACLAKGRVDLSRSNHPESERRVEEVDQWHAMIAAVSCFRGQREAAKVIADAPDAWQLVRIGYRRVEREGRVALRDVRLVRSLWDAPRLDRCIADAVDGAVFDSPDVQLASGDYELGFPRELLSEVVREFDFDGVGQ